MNKLLHVGLDVGSTTVKIVVMDEDLNTLYTNYTRHYSDTKNTVCMVLEDLAKRYPDCIFTIALTGSGAMSAANFLDVPFIQEVVACKRAVEKYIPKTDVVIELGGEDAKIIYFGKSIEQRMNGTCAGGTGAFIDQMASLLNTDTSGLNELAKNHSIIYPIASRCGVFAKTDVQPLINEGAAKEESILTVDYWPDPWTIEKTDPALRVQKVFPLSDEGREAAAAFLQDAFNAEPERWKNCPSMMDCDPWEPAAEDKPDEPKE